jgi:hypothetical protein
MLSPEFPDMFRRFKHLLKFIHKKGSLPPQRAARRLVDVYVMKLGEIDMAWGDGVFINTMIAHQEPAHDLISRCHATGTIVIKKVSHYLQI